MDWDKTLAKTMPAELIDAVRVTQEALNGGDMAAFSSEQIRRVVSLTFEGLAIGGELFERVAGGLDGRYRLMRPIAHRN